MLSKLVKYDIKSLIRVFIPVWIVAPILAILLRGAIHLISVSDGPIMSLLSEYVGPILLGILGILFVAVIVGMMIMTLLLVIRRFWNGLLKEEGYLAFPLPVEVWQLIVSKVIVAAIVNLISGLVAALSCLILFLGIKEDRSDRNPVKYFLARILLHKPLLSKTHCGLTLPPISLPRRMPAYPLLPALRSHLLPQLLLHRPA